MGGGKNDDVTSLSGEWNDLQCPGLAEGQRCPFHPSILPPQLVPQGVELWVMPAPDTRAGLCAGKCPTLEGLSVSQVCGPWALRCLALPSPAWRWKITQKLGGPLTCARAHVRPPASCEPFCWPLPPRLFALTSLIIFCCSYIGPGLGAC